MRGNILITSRNSAMMTLTSPQNSLEVTEMEEKDAIELLSITKLFMKLGSYHTKKFNKGLNLMILIRPMQPIVQCYF